MFQIPTKLKKKIPKCPKYIHTFVKKAQLTAVSLQKSSQRKRFNIVQHNLHFFGNKAMRSKMYFHRLTWPRGRPHVNNQPLTHNEHGKLNMTQWHEVPLWEDVVGGLRVVFTNANICHDTKSLLEEALRTSV